MSGRDAGEGERRFDERVLVLESVLAHVRDAIVVAELDEEGEPRIVFVNPAFTEQTGYTAEEAVGRHPRFLLGPNSDYETQVRIRKSVEARDAVTVEIAHYRKDGTEFWVENTVTPVVDETGAFVRFVSVQHDVTERKRAEAELRESEERFRLLAENAHDVISRYRLAPEPGFDYVSPAVRDVLGFTPEELYADPALVYNLLHPDDVGALAAMTDPAEPVGPVEVRLRHRSGRWVWVELRNVPILGDDGTVVAIEGIARDITEARDAREALRTRAARQEVVVALGQDALGGLDRDELFDLAVAGVAETLGVPHADLFELAPDARALQLCAGSSGDAGGVNRFLSAGIESQPGLALRSGQPVIVHDLDTDDRFTTASAPRPGTRSCLAVPVGGVERPFGVLTASTSEHRSFPPDDVGFVQAVANVLAGAVERQRAEARLRYQALHDGLTGLPNRTLLHEQLDRAIRASGRSLRSVGLLLMDLDRFKAVNDTYGHNVGDVVLRQVGQRLRRVVRGADLVARLGGDEFAVVLPEIDRVDDAQAVAGKVLRMLDQPFDAEGTLLPLGASIGIALAPKDAHDASALLHAADVAMYEAKQRAEGYATYAADYDGHGGDRLAVVSELHDVIEAGGLAVHYQPKIDLRTGRAVGVEALVRWPHPRRGLMAPDLFLPLAEQTGLIKPLSEWVVRAALEEARSWPESGGPIQISINVSTRTLQDPELVETTLAALDDAGVAPSRLVLEVTENSVMSDPEVAMETVSGLAAAGVEISIDDFGTGYSSLAYLQRFPVREIKIDRAFVSGIAGSERDASIIRSIVDLAHELGLRTVAEGVETAEAEGVLARLGCDAAQGHLFARPMTAADLREWLDRGTGALAAQG